MRRGEVVVRRRSVEDSVENRLADEFGRDWVAALSCETVVVFVGGGDGGVGECGLGNCWG